MLVSQAAASQCLAGKAEFQPAFNRLGVKGSLSAINSVSARSVILFEASAERIAAKGEFRKRIHRCFTAQARTAGAVRAGKPRDCADSDVSAAVSRPLKELAS